MNIPTYTLDYMQSFPSIYSLRNPMEVYMSLSGHYIQQQNKMNLRFDFHQFLFFLLIISRL